LLRKALKRLYADSTGEGKDNTDLIYNTMMEAALVSDSSDESIHLIGFLRNKVKKYIKRAERWH